MPSIEQHRETMQAVESLVTEHVKMQGLLERIERLARETDGPLAEHLRDLFDAYHDGGDDDEGDAGELFNDSCT